MTRRRSYCGTRIWRKRLDCRFLRILFAGQEDLTVDYKQTCFNQHVAGIRPAFRAGGPLLLAVASCVTCMLLQGCVSDSMLIEENLSVALRSARFKARTDLKCPQVDVSVESEQVVPGAPWGYLYSDYTIQAEGCGRIVGYDVKCRDEQLCRVKRTGG